VTALEENNWKIQLTWVKAHVGLYGNEMADKLAKEAATDRSLQACYDKIPKSVILSELRDESKAKWETEWHNINNGKVTKSFFPYVRDRLKTKLKVPSSVTAVLTGHGKIKAYLQQFHIIENSMCPCNKREQSVDHILYE
jgi:Ribonuclease HI